MADVCYAHHIDDLTVFHRFLSKAIDRELVQIVHVNVN